MYSRGEEKRPLGHFYKIKKYTDECYKHTFFIDYGLPRAMRTPDERGTVYESKMEESLIRASSKCYEYAMCNEWDYFVTLTLNPDKYDSYDLKNYIKQFNDFLRKLRYRQGVDVKYLLIPERHKKGDWHMHGFLKGNIQDDIVPNGNYSRKTGRPYYHWQAYAKRFGFMSIGEIQNRKAACCYMLKYFTKNISRSVQELEANLYYHSQGLKTATVVYDDMKDGGGYYSQDFPDFLDFEYNTSSGFFNLAWSDFLPDEFKDFEKYYLFMEGQKNG